MIDRSRKLRRFFARYVTMRGRAAGPRIEAAFASVPREPFAGPGPWMICVPGVGYLPTPDDDPAYLYQDALVGLAPERGINIGEPSLHAACLGALALRAGETVLQVGAGAGYYTALLAFLVGPGGCVHAYEIEAGLAARATENLQGRPWVRVHARTGIAEGLPKADAVYVNAGTTQPSMTWLDALRPGGRLIFPLQPISGSGAMLEIVRPARGTAWPARFITRARFIPCQGRQDDAAGRELADRFHRGGLKAVRSLRLGGSLDASCWYAGDGWWLSTQAASEIEAA